MYITYPWLERLIDIQMPPAELAKKLTMVGLEACLTESPEPAAHSEKILDVDLTPNRADCLSIKGIAREISALTGGTLKADPFSLTETDIPTDDYVNISVSAPTKCLKYSARLIRDVKIADSPQWLANLLLSVGIRPVNNVVDITNYILWYEGQPLHAFDYNLIKGKNIHVRPAEKGEKFVTLDGKERSLSIEDLVIAGEHESIALAGVMGGANTEVDETTHDILLESALFDPASIMKTSRSLGIHTESSHRFARGVDPEGVVPALERAASMITDLAGGKVLKGTVTFNSSSGNFETKRVSLRPARVNKLLGTNIDAKEIISILETLSFSVNTSESILTVSVPSFRQDIEREIDLIEEVARIHGFGNIKTTLPAAVMTQSDLPKRMLIEKEIRDLLTAKGINEAINYSFISGDDYFPYHEKTENGAIVLKNPISSEMTTMRQSLIPGLLKNFVFNQKRGNLYPGLFEMGNIFIEKSTKIEEKTLLAIAITPRVEKSLWEKRENDFFSLKGFLDSIIKKLKLPKPALLKRENSQVFHPGKSAQISIKGEMIGSMGELHPDFISSHDLTAPPLIIEIDLNRLCSLAGEKIKYRPLSRFPVVNRDLSLTIDSSIDCDTLISLIKERGGDILLGVTIFDIYEGKQIPKGKKSVACAVRFGSEERTLLEEEINAAYEDIFTYLSEKTGSTLREGG